MSDQAAWEPVSDEELHAAFRAFANFGSGSGSTPKSATPKAFELDGARFAKLVRPWYHWDTITAAAPAETVQVFPICPERFNPAHTKTPVSVCSPFLYLASTGFLTGAWRMQRILSVVFACSVCHESKDANLNICVMRRCVTAGCWTAG